LGEARAPPYSYRQRVDFEPNGTGEVGMAYHRHQGVWGGIRIIDGYEGFHAMVMIGSWGVQTTESILININTD
jgi:hypothetical protein